MRPYSFTKSLLKSSFAFLLTSTILFGFSFSGNAQATLSIQGIIKRSNGVALEDGAYSIKFNIYAKDDSPAGVLWTETINEVDVNGGIYSEILGANPSSPLTLPFDQDYELGIEIGGKEMTPKIRLTSAPYALSLRGETNQFPSTGQVLADEIIVAQGVLASGGAPGLNGVDKNGYAFQGNSGDNDSGLFSTADAKVSLYANNIEKVSVTPTEITLNGTTTVQGALGANQINLYNNGGINYSSNQGSFPGWRMADVDDFSSGSDGWQVYNYTPNLDFLGFATTTPAGNPPNPDYGAFVGRVLEPELYGQVLKKQYTIAGSFSEIKVRFRYYAFDTWDGTSDAGVAGFATSVGATTFRIGWLHSFSGSWNYNGLNPANFQNATKINGGNVSDQYVDVEMSARASGNSFWLMIGAALNAVPGDESYGIGPVEVYVR